MFEDLPPLFVIKCQLVFSPQIHISPLRFAMKPEWWTSGKNGSLSPWSQAKVCALWTVSEELGLDMQDGDVAALVQKVGGGIPTKQSIAKYRVLFESDPDWYPGKTTEGARKRGPKPRFTITKQRAVAKCAMALKEGGVEPTVAEVVARCPAAALNPGTGESFCTKLIVEVFKTRCYDSDPSHPWQHQYPLQKTALSEALIDARFAWARKMVSLQHSGAWYHRSCVWLDPCSSIVPGEPRATFDQNQASYGKSKRWMSKDSRVYSRNLRASPYGGKQNSWGSKRVWWFVIVTRGVVHFEIMPDTWQQTGEGMAELVARLPKILDRMLGPNVAKPRVIISDRGPGLYHASTGGIVQVYAAALKRYGFRPFAGEDASWQPPDLADLFMHETVAGWARKIFKKRPLLKVNNLQRNYDNFVDALQECEDHINENYDVDGLCRSLPSRLAELKKVKGDRLSH